MQKINKLIVACLLMVSPTLNYACESNQRLDEMADKGFPEVMSLYIWKTDNGYLFKLSDGSRSVSSVKSIIIAAPVIEQCQMERFLTQIKALGKEGKFIVSLVYSPNSPDFLRIAPPKGEFEDILRELRNITEGSQLELSVLNDDDSSSIFEMFR